MSTYALLWSRLTLPLYQWYTGVIVRTDLALQFVSCTSPHGRTTECRHSRHPCWLSTGNSTVTTASHREARTSSTAVPESVVRARSLRWTCCCNRRGPSASSTCSTVCGRWGRLASTWFRRTYVLCSPRLLSLLLYTSLGLLMLDFLARNFPFSALTLLVGWQEGHPAGKKLGVGLLVVMISLELCSSCSSSCHYRLHHP